MDPNNLPYAAPTDYNRNRRSEMFQEWTAQVQQLLPGGWTAQVGYLGIQADHLSSKSYENGINPLTGARPLPQFGQIGTVGSWENSSYNALQTSVQRTTRSGLFLKFNYSWSHALNEDSQGGGGPAQPQNAACIACEWGNSASDQRQALYGSASYPLPFGQRKPMGRMVAQRGQLVSHRVAAEHNHHSQGHGCTGRQHQQPASGFCGGRVSDSGWWPVDQRLDQHCRIRDAGQRRVWK